MAVRRLAEEQPESFEFTPENLAWAKRKVEDYPAGRQASAVIPILWRAQAQHRGWLPEPAIRLVADMLEMPYIRVLEIATFYTMFQLKPVGTVAHVNVCGTTPCMLRGAEEIVAICKKRIAAHPLELSGDGRFSWEEVECAGACVNAPMVQIDGENYEDLTPESFTAILDTLSSGGTPRPGPQSDRRTSEPLSGQTSLTEPIEPKKPSTGPEPDPDALPEQGVDPSTPEAAHESAGKPDGEDGAEAEASRSGAPQPEDTEHEGAEPESDVVGHDAEAEGLTNSEAVDVTREETAAAGEDAPAADTAPSAPDTAGASEASAESDAAEAPAEHEAAEASAQDDAAEAPAERDAAEVSAERDAAEASAQDDAAEAPAERDAAEAPAEDDAARIPAEEGAGADEAEPATAEAAPTPEDAPEPPDSTATARANESGNRPHGVHRDTVPEVDNLQQISGIGPVIERRLNDLGVFTLAQIAEWDEANRNWVNAYLAFKGRIDRERWVEQAQELVNQSKNA